MPIRLRLSADLSVGLQLEVSTPQSAFRHWDGGRSTKYDRT
jgi:hypothetical protein